MDYSRNVHDESVELGEWDCEAYGEQGRIIGARCFVGDSRLMRCRNRDVCHDYMTLERMKLFAAIRKDAAEGDPTSKYLASVFTSPQMLLNANNPESATFPTGD